MSSAGLSRVVLDVAEGPALVESVDGASVSGTGVGVALTALGAWLIYGSIVEEQPGSGVQWHPQDMAATR